MAFKQEEIKPYGGADGKGKEVERMFDNIAPTYDKLNHRLSWDIDKWWRKKAIRRLAAFKPKRILDVATGTGDFAIQAARSLAPESVIGVDISESMMEIGRQKASEEGLDDVIRFQKEDCMDLGFPKETFDAVIAAFGIRNFQDLERGLREIYRVLKDGGEMTLLELTMPVSFPWRQLFRLYSHSVLPLYGKIISGDKAAYSYLTKTIDAFPQGETMMDVLRKIGFTEVGFQRLTFGICTLYYATK